jgi:hypothetical protein
MELSNSEQIALEKVRRLERVRIQAIRGNDADDMEEILENKFIYINSEGKLFNKESNIRSVRSHGLIPRPADQNPWPGYQHCLGITTTRGHASVHRLCSMRLGITYDSDLELTQTGYRVDGDLVILAGLMLGHARLDREQHIYRHRNMCLWRERRHDWKFLTSQSSAITHNPPDSVH